MKIRTILFLFAAVLFAFLPLIGALAQMPQGAADASLTGNATDNVVVNFLTQYSQYAYVVIVWVVGVLIKRFGDTVPLLNQLTETSYRVLAFGILLGVAFYKFGGESLFEYIKLYGLAALAYILGLDKILNGAGNVVFGQLPPKLQSAPPTD
jgi:hypothetical protein